MVLPRICILFNPLAILTALDLISHMRVVSAIQARSEKEMQPTAVQSVVPITPSSSLSGSVAPASDFNPLGPMVMCSFLPRDFLECKDPIDHDNNRTAKAVKGYGCLHFGGSTYDEVEHTEVQCTVFSDIDCYGPRTFLRDGVPCVRYTDHYFVTTLIYSILLGFLGMDRFCLGQTGTAVGKLLTIGGVGVWWVIDIILLITNNLLPEDGSNWNPYV
ncbi:TM2 domain-containing protein CG11103 [Anastrepha obliqua]|uniref:TM2 domain-containing protein CG11103 n=1 Tax=Anastrepha obliqua TaxID=95512 RepID=UPI002409BD33|nr:TM2 domain-containing protein CG11103 [Anastrepha obliqua]